MAHLAGPPSTLGLCPRPLLPPALPVLRLPHLGADSYDRAARSSTVRSRTSGAPPPFPGREGRGWLASPVRRRHAHLSRRSPHRQSIEAIDEGFGLSSGRRNGAQSLTPAPSPPEAPKVLHLHGLQPAIAASASRISQRLAIADEDQPAARPWPRRRRRRLPARGGFASVNFDLMYGLPAQTSDSVAKTAEQAASLRPDHHLGLRLCPRGNQKMINDAELHCVRARYAQASHDRAAAQRPRR